MYKRLLNFLRCPDCGNTLDLHELDLPEKDGGDISRGLLQCGNDHWFPIVGGIPRMLPDALQEHWTQLEGLVTQSKLDASRALQAGLAKATGPGYDRQTRASFSSEWEHHQPGDKTWGMDLDDRVKWFFLESIRMSREDLSGKVVLDAGCGNGSQSVAYTEFGAEVIAVDISSGLERGHTFRRLHPRARPEMVHFVQADLQRPPLAPASVDIIHSSGVLHHTPSTERSFRGLVPLLRPGGTFYTWVYKREPVVTPVVNGIRAVTTKLPPPIFAKLAGLLGPPFVAFCRAVDKLGVRKYPPMSRREATIALLDIFGAPYAHYHSYPEVASWYQAVGFDEVWPCNDDRRGFGVCGRKVGVVEKARPGTATEVAGRS